MRTIDSTIWNNMADSISAKYTLRLSWKVSPADYVCTEKATAVKYQQSLPDGNISFGNVPAAMLQFSINEDDLINDLTSQWDGEVQTNLENEVIYARVYVDVLSDKYLDLGTLKIMKSEKNGKITTYTAYDQVIYKLDRAMTFNMLTSDGQYRTKQAIRDVCKQCGMVENVDFDLEYFSGTKIEIPDIPIAIVYIPDGITCRQFIGYMAGFYGANAMMVGGILKLVRFATTEVDYSGGELRSTNSTTGVYRIDENCYYESGVTFTTEKPFQVAKIVYICSASEGGNATTYTTGIGRGDDQDVDYVVGSVDTGIGYSNPFMTDSPAHLTVMDNIFCTLSGRTAGTVPSSISTGSLMSIRGMEVKMLGDWRLEIGDMILVVKEDKLYDMTIMSIEHEFDGGLITVLRSFADTESANTIDLSGASGSSTAMPTTLSKSEANELYGAELNLTGSVLKLLSKSKKELAKLTLPGGVLYDIANAITAGISKLYTGTGTNTDGSITQKALTTLLDGKSDMDHTHDGSGGKTYTPGTGISISSDNKINHSNAVTAGKVGDETTGTTSLYAEDTFKVPRVEYDEEGHITSAGAKTYKLKVGGGEAVSLRGKYLIDTEDDKGELNAIPYMDEHGDLIAGKSINFYSSSGRDFPTLLASIMARNDGSGVTFSGLTKGDFDGIFEGDFTGDFWGSLKHIVITDWDLVEDGLWFCAGNALNSPTSPPPPSPAPRESRGISAIYNGEGFQFAFEPSESNYLYSRTKRGSDWTAWKKIENYTPGTGLVLSGTKINHSNSITAGTASEGGTPRTLAYGEAFNVPKFDYDAQGHITGTSSTALKLPASSAGKSTSYTTISGWNRIIQSSTSSIGCGRCHADVACINASGSVTAVFHLDCALSFGKQPKITITNLSHYAIYPSNPAAITGVRIVYDETAPASTAAYIEVNCSGINTIYIQNLQSQGTWGILNTSAVAGSVPSGYKSAEIALNYENTIQTYGLVNAPELLWSGSSSSGTIILSKPASMFRFLRLQFQVTSSNSMVDGINSSALVTVGDYSMPVIYGTEYGADGFAMGLFDISGGNSSTLRWSPGQYVLDVLPYSSMDTNSATITMTAVYGYR